MIHDVSAQSIQAGAFQDIAITLAGIDSGIVDTLAPKLERIATALETLAQDVAEKRQRELNAQFGRYLNLEHWHDQDAADEERLSMLRDYPALEAMAAALGVERQS
jgi:hypothetical protein